MGGRGGTGTIRGQIGASGSPGVSGQYGNPSSLTLVEQAG
jgi:hypothetical protein